MSVTDEMVDRMCRVLAEEDWLPKDWEGVESGICPHCGQSLAGEGDGGEEIRREVRQFLEVALGPEREGVEAS